MAGEIQLNSVTLATESGGVASIDSSVDIKGPLNASGSAPIYACRAWVNFNGTGTVAIRASGNVSSITDNGTGRYTVNFTTSLSDQNYAVSGWAGSSGSTSSSVYNVRGGDTDMMQNDSVKIRVIANDAGSSSLSDISEICVSIFR